MAFKIIQNGFCLKWLIRNDWAVQNQSLASVTVRCVNMRASKVLEKESTFTWTGFFLWNCEMAGLDLNVSRKIPQSFWSSLPELSGDVHIADVLFRWRTFAVGETLFSCTFRAKLSLEDTSKFSFKLKTCFKDATTTCGSTARSPVCSSGAGKISWRNLSMTRYGPCWIGRNTESFVFCSARRVA